MPWLYVLASLCFVIISAVFILTLAEFHLAFLVYPIGGFRNGYGLMAGILMVEACCLGLNVIWIASLRLYPIVKLVQCKSNRIGDCHTSAQEGQIHGSDTREAASGAVRASVAVW